MKVFSGSSNKPLVEKIAKQLNTSLSPLEIFIFPDGERRIRAIDRVVGQDTVVIQSTSPNPDTAYMELFFIVDALKRSGAKSVVAVVPYLGYQRQDHVFRDGEAVSLEVIIETLESVGMDKLITFDLHSIKIPELFKIPIVHLSALPFFAEKIKEIIGQGAEVAPPGRGSPRPSDTILVSPDMGGIRRIKILSELLSNMPFVSIVKDRDLKTGNISSSSFDTESPEWKKGVKRAIIVDDMISTGRTIVSAVDLLIKNGIEENLIFATHPVFSNDAKNILQNSRASKIFVTDTIDISEKGRFAKLEILSVANLIANGLRN